MITIIDYKSGNLRSIFNAFKKFNQEVEITSDVEKMTDVKCLVYGVGAFGTSMKNLKPFKSVIHEHVNGNNLFSTKLYRKKVVNMVSKS